MCHLKYLKMILICHIHTLSHSLTHTHIYIYAYTYTHTTHNTQAAFPISIVFRLQYARLLKWSCPPK